MNDTPESRAEAAGSRGAASTFYGPATRERDEGEWTRAGFRENEASGVPISYWERFIETFRGTEELVVTGSGVIQAQTKKERRRGEEEATRADHALQEKQEEVAAR